MGDPLCMKSSSEENIPGWLSKHWGDYVTPVKNPSAIHLCTDKEPVLNLPSQLQSLLPFSDYSIYLPWSNKHTVLLGYLFPEITKRRHGYLRSYLVSTTSVLLFPISVEKPQIQIKRQGGCRAVSATSISNRISTVEFDKLGYINPGLLAWTTSFNI